MKTIFFVLGLLVVSNITLAANKDLDRKQVYELQKSCGRSAQEFYSQWRDCKDGKGTYENHYNIKLNKCFIDIFTICLRTGDSKRSLLDVHESKMYGRYDEENGKRFLCYVNDKQCDNKGAFADLVEPYMTE